MLYMFRPADAPRLVRYGTDKASIHHPGYHVIRVYLACDISALRYAPEMELVKHAINFSQRDVDGSVDVSLYKVKD